MMDWKGNPLTFDAGAACEEIPAFIERKRVELKRDGVIMGLSGGLDSAVAAYLTARGVERDRIILLNMPDKDSKPRHQEDAAQIADVLGIPLKTQEITPILDAAGIYKLLPLRFVPGRGIKNLLVQLGKKYENLNKGNLLAERFSPKAGSLVAKGNAYATVKHRTRMVMLYHHANIHNLMVVGAANKTEWLTGTFSQWGCDQCADVMPVVHLYRSQLEALAEYLQLPANIRTKPADPDIIPGLDNKEELLGSFYRADLILWGLENKIPMDELIDQFGNDEVNRIVELYESSRFMREAPYTLNDPK